MKTTERRGWRLLDWDAESGTFTAQYREDESLLSDCFGTVTLQVRRGLTDERMVEIVRQVESMLEDDLG